MFKLKSISRSLKGGETMKTLGLVLALVLVVGGAAVADTVTLDTYAGWNQISVPLVPINPDPVSVFTDVNSSNPFDLMGNTTLSRFDAAQGETKYYDAFAAVPGGDFGNCLLGEGYQLNDSVGHRFDYQGIADGVPDGSGQMTDMWISLPGKQYDNEDAGGWQLIGQPFNHSTRMNKDDQQLGDNIYVTDGTTLKTLTEAADPSVNWIETSFAYFDAASRTTMYADPMFGNDEYLRPGLGYWVRTHKDNLALIIPAN